MFEPSLVLLIFKTILIFCFSALTGWSVNYRLLVKTMWVNWVVFTVLGASLLNLVCLWAVLLGFPGWTGLSVVVLLVVVKLIVLLRVNSYVFRFTKQRAKQVLSPIILLCSLSTVNYFVPFVIEGTSGYYSRGGGDHSTYLVFSEWFVKNPMWEKAAPYELMPSQRHWEAKQFVDVKSLFYPDNYQPLANQFIATPFMSILPGSNEETYTAAVAFYISMGCWSTLALLFVLLKREAIRWWAFVPLFLSNLIIFAATCQSIPYLLAISMINVTLLLYWVYTKEPLWQTDIQKYGYFLPLGLMHAALLAIYPHGFFMLMAFMGFMAIGCQSWEGFKRYFILCVTATLFGIAVVNFLLLINIPNVFAGLRHADEYGNKGYHFLHIIASYSGISDFLVWYPNIEILQKKAILGLISFVFLLRYAGKIFISALPTVKPFLASLFIIPIAGIIYYHFHENGSYQIVRFEEIGHLYLLAMAGFAFSSIAEKSPKQVLTPIAVVLFLIIPEVGMRALAVKEVLSTDHFFATEFRNAEALEGIKKIAAMQNHAKGVAANRVAYYFGPGDGVDFAGGSVLLRNLHSLHARGNTMASYFDWKFPGTNTRAWKKKWLDEAILVIRPESDIDIIEDLRSGAFSKPLLDTARLKIYDSQEQPLTQLIGDSWHTMIFFPFKSAPGARPYRYLKGAVGTIVVWSKNRKKINLSLFLNANAPDSRIRIDSDLFSERSKTFNIPKLEKVVPVLPTIQLELDLNPGANVIKLTPQRDGGQPPWFLFWKVRVT